MPEEQKSGTLLRGGEFYSRVEARLRTDDVLLSELRQPCPRTVPRHQHELAYVTVVLDGDYLEGDRGKLEELRPLTAVFNPSGAQHATVIYRQFAAFRRTHHASEVSKTAIPNSRPFKKVHAIPARSN